MNTENGKIGFEIGLNNDRLKEDVRESRKIFKSLNDDVKNDCSVMDASFKNLGRTIAATFTIQQASLFVNQIIKVRGEIESLEKSFEILAGKDLGRKLFAEIKDFAVTTPMAMGDLAKGAQTMLAFGMAAQDIMPILRAIGDISMGNAQKFNSLVLSFSQMRSQGKLMGNDFLQMVNAGFNPLQIIADQTGKEIKDLKEEMSAGAISADMITKAFMDATSAGGLFYGMLDAQSKGIELSMSNLEGAIEDMLNKIGEKNQGLITGSIQTATELVNNYEDVGRMVSELVATYGLYKAAVMTLSVVENLRYQATLAHMAGMTKMQIITDILRAKTEALNVVMAKNPYVLAGIAVAALGLALYKLATYQTEAEKAMERLDETTKDYNKSLASEQIQIDSLFARLKNAKEGTDDYKTAKQAIINQYGSYLDGLSSEIQSLQDVEGAYKAVTEAATNAAKARAMESASKQAADTYAEKEAEAKDDIYNALKKKFGDSKGNDGRLLAETYYWQLIGAMEGKNEASQDLIKMFDKTHFIAGDAMHGIGSYSYTTNAITEAFTKARNARGVYDKTMEEATRRFGTNPQAIENESGNDPKAEVVKNKKYWEDYLKEQQGLLDAMTEAELKSDKADEIRKNINNARNKISAYDTKDTASGRRTLNEMLADIESTANATKQAQQKASKERIAFEKEMHFEQEQNRINLEEDAMKRKEMQMALDSEKEIYNLEKQRDAAVQAEIERQKAIFDAREKGKKAADENYVEKTFSESDLNKDEIANIYAQYNISFGQLIQMQKQREQEYHAEQQRAMNEYLAEYGSYLEKRNATIALYDERIKNASTQGEKDTLAAKMREELSALDMEANKTTSAIAKLFDDMSGKTLKDLRSIAEAGEEAFQFLMSGEWDEEKGIKLGISKETFETLRQSPEELEKIRKGIKDVTDAADKSENAFGKMAKGLEKVFKAGESHTKLQEGLGLIEDGLNDCLQVGGFLSDTLSSLGDAFGSGALSGIAEGLNVAMDAANSAMSGANVGAMFGPIGSAVGGAIGLVSSLGGAFAKLHDKKHEKRIQKIQDQIEELEKNYEKLSRSIEKAYSKDASKLIEDQNTLLQQQKILIQQQIKEEEEKKKTDKERIKEWKNEIEEIDQLISDNKDAAIDAIFGEDVNAAIGDFASSYADAWASSEDKAESAKDTVKRMMRQMVTESIKAAIQSSGAMEQIRKKLQQFYTDNVLSGWEQDYIYRMAEELQKQLDSQFGWADSLMTDPVEESEREGVKKGIATASQESVDENNARLTTIQGHTFGIKADTEAMRKEMAAAREMQREVRDLAYTAVEHLAEISKNTRELYETNRRLKSVEESLDDINTRGVIIRK